MLKAFKPIIVIKNTCIKIKHIVRFAFTGWQGQKYHNLRYRVG